MQYAQFLATIRHVGEFDGDFDNDHDDDGNHAEQATIATLSILGRQLAGHESPHLSAQLSIELQELLTQRDGDGAVAMEGFLSRIADEEGFGCETDQTRAHAKTVLSTLAAAISGHELATLRAQLPADYTPLFDPWLNQAQPLRHLNNITTPHVARPRTSLNTGDGTVPAGL